MKVVFGRLCQMLAVGVMLHIGIAETPLAAQLNGDATVNGIVLDPAGKALPAAAVIIRGESTSLVRTTTTDADGRFTARGFTQGLYTIEISAPGFATTRRQVTLLINGVHNLTFNLKVSDLSQTVTVEASVGLATQTAPSSGSLDERSAKSEINSQFIQNFTSPVSDYSEILQMAPGTFSVNPNGIGLGDSKTYFRGFADGQYTMTFDGIPFNDTNTPTHHSWAFVPGQWIGGVDFDRSPGSAASIGPTNFGGSINLLSHEVPADQNIRATVSYGSFNTRLLDLKYDSGEFGGHDKRSSLEINLHQLNSDGYQTFNFQKRVGGSLKYQYRVSDRMTITVWGGLIDLFTNTPNTKGPTRAQVAQFGDNFLMTDDPKNPSYFRYNFYHVQTDFEYVGVKYDIGRGWFLDNKTYTYRYWNKQNYNGTTISTTSAVDKLNGYRKVGDVLSLVKDTTLGTFRTGLWYEWAYTDRYQIPSDPRTWVNAALPNFHENFNTNSYQPYAEWELRVTPALSITPGLKLAHYRQDFLQFPDNGGAVGTLGGLPFVKHAADYNSWLPSFDVRYRLRNNWSTYFQFATGSVIPPSSVFDTKNGSVAVLPNPTQTKTYQVGTVFKGNRYTLDFDAYYIRFENPYSTTTDPSGEPVYYLTGESITKGVEAESNILLGKGFNLYLNGSAGNAKYASSGLWVQNAPRNTETVGFTYQRKSWDGGFFNKRIGQMYNDYGKGNVLINQAVTIQPFNLTNLFVNYTIKGESAFKQTKIRLSVNNVFDKHSIVGVGAALASGAASPNDVLTLLPARSVMLTVTFGFAPGRH